MLVGAPSYFALHGHPEHPRDLAMHRALRYVHSRIGETWRFRHAEQGEFSQIVPPALRVNNAEALIPALHAGLGLAMQPEFLVWDDLRTGRVEATLTDWMIDPIALHIVTPPGRAKPARVQALIQFLAETFGAAPWAKDADQPPDQMLGRAPSRGA
jgi:DNA-binding transcriptional LysR family regulator